MNSDGLYSRCKRGWNWHFTFSETTRDGNAVTVVRQELLWRSRSGLDVIVSKYPYGHGAREDAVVEAVNRSVFGLRVDGHENDLLIEEVNGRDSDLIIISASIDSEIVQGFAESLSGIRRVIVDVKSQNRS